MALSFLNEPYGFINSSFAVFFHVTVIAVAPFFANYFPDSFGALPLVVCIGLPIIFFWLFWLMRNHGDNNITLLAIPGFALLCGFFGLAAAIKGPITTGELPVILTTTIPSIPLLNLFYFSYTDSAPILASIVMYYGAVTYLVATALAFAVEYVYDLGLRRLVPKSHLKKLAKADLEIDRKLFIFFDRNWGMGQNIGGLFTLIILVLFSVMYGLVLLLT